MQLWENTAGKVKPAVWIWAGVCSIALFALVLWQVDWHQLQEIIQTASVKLLVLAMLVLLLEGFFTAKRMHILTSEAPNYVACLQVIAWFVVLLVVLPARLGEIAIIFLMGYFLKQKSGSAVINAFSQRLFDLIVLSIFFLFLVLVQNQTANQEWYLIAGIGCFILLVVALLSIKPILKWLTAKYPIDAVKQVSLRGKLVTLLHDAQAWYQQNMDRRKVIIVFMLTVGKWCCNLGGIALLLLALRVPLSFVETSFLAAAYNFLAVIPIQSIGGFGVSEAGLTGLLVLFDQSLSYAASISVVTRIFLILNPLLFWSLVMILIWSILQRKT